MSKFVYADNAATTPVSREVIEAMQPCFAEAWGNPSSQHSKGAEAKALLDDARARIAAVFNCRPGEIYFTSCGTESDNWAIRGAAYKARAKGKTHIVTSKIEHHAVLHACRALEKEGFEVTYVGVDEFGVVDLEELRSVVTEKTALVAIMKQAMTPHRKTLAKVDDTISICSRGMVLNPQMISDTKVHRAPRKRSKVRLKRLMR